MGNIYRTSFGLKVSSGYTSVYKVVALPSNGVLSAISARIQTAASWSKQAGKTRAANVFSCSLVGYK